MRVNGEVWGEDTSAHMHHSFAAMIAYASRSQTLRAGEVLGSGTAAGGSGLELDRWLAEGDVVELEVEGIGVLRNTHRTKGSMTMAYVVSAKWRAKDGKEDRLLEVIREMTPPSRAEPGNRFYQAQRSLEDPQLFYLYEQYADEAGYQAHMDSEHFTRLVKERGDPRAARGPRARVLRDDRRRGRRAGADGAMKRRASHRPSRTASRARRRPTSTSSSTSAPAGLLRSRRRRR